VLGSTEFRAARRIPEGADSRPGSVRGLPSDA